MNGEWGTNIRLLFGGGGALNDRTLVLCLVTESTNTFTLLHFRDTRDNIDIQYIVFMQYRYNINTHELAQLCCLIEIVF